MLTALVITSIMVLLSAFFSGIEIAFLSSNKLKITLKSQQGDEAAATVTRFYNQTSKVLATILVGNNIALVVYGIFVAGLLDLLFLDVLSLNLQQESVSNLVLQTAVSTLIILIFGEYTPKALIRLNPDRVILSFAWLLNFFYKILSPITIVINGMSKALLRTLFRIDYEEQEITFGKKDLNHFVRESLSENHNAPVHEINTEMFNNAMDFNKIRARDCMIPRTEIISLDVSDPIEELKKIFIETKLSRVILYKDSLDQVIGYAHCSSMLKRPNSIAECIQPVLIVPETMPAHVLLNEFSEHKRSTAIVVDEFGGTAGLLTMEDLVETVFGDIEDEHDTPEGEMLLEKKLDDGAWLFSARLEIDYLNEKYHLGLPEGEYQTLGGMMMHYLEAVPRVNDFITIGHCQCIVTEASNTKILQVRLVLVGRE